MMNHEITYDTVM